MKREQIRIDHGDGKKLAEMCKCSLKTVRDALKGTSRGKKSDMARDYALKYFKGTIVK